MSFPYFAQRGELSSQHASRVHIEHIQHPACLPGTIRLYIHPACLPRYHKAVYTHPACLPGTIGGIPTSSMPPGYHRERHTRVVYPGVYIRRYNQVGIPGVSKDSRDPLRERGKTKRKGEKRRETCRERSLLGMVGGGYLSYICLPPYARRCTYSSCTCPPSARHGTPVDGAVVNDSSVRVVKEARVGRRERGSSPLRK